MDQCWERVYWYDGEYDDNCELPDGHEGHHFDGLSCFTADGETEEVYGCEQHDHAARPPATAGLS